MSIIKAEGLTRRFQVGRETVTALSNISLEIEKGAFTILRGRSGSGKTTLINMLGALDYPSEGRVFLEDREITEINDAQRDQVRRKNFGFVFQSVALMSLMTAFENVDFGLRISGMDARERQTRAEECLKLVGLAKRMKHRPQELSGGEQQRVAIARALAHRPAVILADEPTGELDTVTGLQIVKVFRTLIQNEGITVVMTTHDPSMAEIADHVFTLEDGEIVDRQ